MPESRSFLALAARLACFSGLSRALGLVRDLCIAWIMGTGPLADMLAQALRLPHIFRRLLAEGVLSLPLTQAFMQGGGSSLPSDCLPAQLFTVLHRKLLFLLLPLLLLALLFSPLLARLLAGSFLPPAPALVLLLCLVLPYLFCVCMAALCMAYLHAQNVFWVSAFSPVLFNILLLLALFLAHLFPRDASLLIALALTLSGGVQWLFQRHFALRCVLAAEVKKLDGSERLGDT